MASAALRSQLQERALRAEKLLEQLRPCLAALKEATMTRRCSEEAEKLRKENEKLKSQVEVMVERLKKAEIRNGVHQVKYNRPSASRATVVVANSVSEKAEVKVEETIPEETQKPKSEKKTKVKKESKPAATESAADDSAPVDVSRLLLKVGKIVDVKKHPDADSLYVETVDLAEEKSRTIVSGLVKHVPIEKMQDRLAVFACNLKPAKMRGILSEGMIMCASTPEKVQVVDVPTGAVPGDIVSFPGYSGAPDKQLNPKKKIWEQLMPDFKTDAEGVACYKDSPFTIEGKGVCQAPGCPNFPIK